MPITYSEKTIFSKQSKSIADMLLHLDQDNFENTVLLFKVLAHALRNNEVLIEGLDESIFERPELLKEKIYVLLQHALTVATAAATSTVILKDYSPAQLGKFFGVSVVTIHKWIKQNRFVGVEIAGDNKHNRISENTEFITNSGDRMLVSEVAEMWHKQEAEMAALERQESQLEYYTRLIADYEQKYGGEFERTLGAKVHLTPEEQTDAEIWSHLLGRQNIEFGDSKE
ncbi:hypothetical protein [Paenibacillus sp. MMO-58]|uniref:hypothetical protein n=1 Tax=Paenibacillus sp. MMO-58 TaxID=3081290 RepID=UPI00301B59EC